MIDGDCKYFVETVHLGEDVFFIYQGIQYHSQGWFIKDQNQFVLNLEQEEPYVEDYLWYKTGPDRDALAEEMLAAPVFNGKSFWDIEPEVQWID